MLNSDIVTEATELGDRPLTLTPQVFSNMHAKALVCLALPAVSNAMGAITVGDTVDDKDIKVPLVGATQCNKAQNLDCDIENTYCAPVTGQTGCPAGEYCYSSNIIPDTNACTYILGEYTCWCYSKLAKGAKCSHDYECPVLSGEDYSECYLTYPGISSELTCM